MGVPSILRSHHQSLQPQRRNFYVSAELSPHLRWQGTSKALGGCLGLALPLAPPASTSSPGGPCTWVRERLRLSHRPRADSPRAAESFVPPCRRAGPHQQLALQALGSACFRGGEASRGTPPRPHKTGSPSVTRTPRAPPASGQDAFTSGGWAVPAPPTSLRTSGTQGGPGAGPGRPRELRTRRRNLDRMVGCCPLFTLQPACPQERPSC